MKTLRPFLYFVLAGTLAGAPTPPAPAKGSVKTGTPQPFSPRFKQVRDRISDLYRHRNEMPPPPDPKLNPFRAPGTKPIIAITTPGEKPEVVVPPPATNIMVLQQGAASLKISGIFEIGGRSHLVINARPYKEGDVVQTQVGGETVYLRVREITRRSVTLTLHDAEITLGF